ADGTVRIATEQGAAYGVTVYIDHVIDGSVITSHYSHMQYPDAAIQWPFLVGVGMSYGYGSAAAASTRASDFVPGNGAPIQATRTALSASRPSRVPLTVSRSTSTT
ncbi:hypothetical protein CTI14_54360, partial [Methylobacterium radiotolerans]